PKLGLVLSPGCELAGRVVVVPIGVADAEVGRDVRTFLLEAADVAPLFPRRTHDAHKGTYGHLLVLAGSVGKTRAAALCARAPLSVWSRWAGLSAPSRRWGRSQSRR